MKAFTDSHLAPAFQWFVRAGGKNPAMKRGSREPLFTGKEWLLIVSLWVFYAGALFSLDPQWVAWAAPIAFGGALVATAPPPSVAFSAPPRQVVADAVLISVLCVAVLTFLAFLRGESGLLLSARLERSLKAGRLSRISRAFSRRAFAGKSHARALLRAPRGSSIGQQSSEGHPSPAAGSSVTAASQRSRIVPRSL